MLSYVLFMLCYVITCHVMLCYITCNVMLRYITLCFVFVRLCYITCYLMLRSIPGSVMFLIQHVMFMFFCYVL